MSKMITVESGFQYSVNIGYDLNNDDKLKNFIPTNSSLKLLEEILLSTNPQSSDRARVLIGAYGKGKSHLVLMILSLLMKKDLKLFEKTLPKINGNTKLLQLVNNYYESKNKILPVVITGSNTSLNQAFLVALQRTLSDNDLLDAMPETNYKAAKRVIERWKDDFPDTYIAFEQKLDEPIEEFVTKLDNYDSYAYESFEKIYPTLTAGSSFNPFLGFDVVDLYESVAKGISSAGYTGIYVVYDEFSKYLESNIETASVSDTKMLQDFAEKCNRSGNLQMHLMLISHKEISNYIDKLPKQKLDGWRGVSDRFKHVRINNNFSQTYEIISSVIHKKDDEWNSFCNHYSGEFSNLYQRYQNHSIFHDSESILDIAIKGCFPLHPVSTFILPRLSEKVAQNERTLFTFLSAHGTSTLPSFLDKYNDDGFNLIKPDQIYDYFAPLFRKEAYDGSTHTIFMLADTIINQLEEDSLESKIVKTIALIYILEQFEKIKPTIEEIIGVYSTEFDVNKIEEAIRLLIERDLVVYIKRSNNYLRLKKNSGVDVNQKIKDRVASNAKKETVKETLNASNFDKYLYPSRYNDEHEMTRYFSFEFIDDSEVKPDVNWDIKSEKIDADGVIYGVIPADESRIKAIKDLLIQGSRNYPRFIFVLPKHYREIESIIREYSAVVSLRDEAINDPMLFDEYELLFEDLQEIVDEYITLYTHPEKHAAYYICNGAEVQIRRKASFTEMMSDICDQAFFQTPVINNESVNKNTITSIAATSRNKIVSGLLRSELEHNLGLTGTGQDVSIMRSTLVRTRILTEEGGFVNINLRPDDDRMSYMLTTIEDFIAEARRQGSVNFSLLYERLTAPEHHIGLRLGVIPIYLAAVIHEYRKQVIITGSYGQVPVSSEVLAQINSEPYKYNLEYLDWNPEKEAYIERLSAAFVDKIIEAEKSGNSYDYVSNAMKRWYMSLPKYSKESIAHPGGGAIVKRQREVIKLLKQNNSSTDLLFKKLPEAFNYQEDFTADVAEEVVNTRRLYDSLLDELKEFLITRTKEIFITNGEGGIARRKSLPSILREWIDTLDASVFEQLFADGTERFLVQIKKMTNDEDLLISVIAKLATDLRVEDWDKDTYKIYLESIKRYKRTAEEYHGNVITESIDSDINTYQIMFSDEFGETITKRFDKGEITSRGKLLFNQINSAIESMGQSISDQEKRQILMEVLKRLC